MRTSSRRWMTVVAAVALGAAGARAQAPAGAAAPSLLTRPGVYGVFAFFTVRPDWARAPAAERARAPAEVARVVKKHADVVHVELSLSRGLEAQVDLFARVHAQELEQAQAFLIDLRATAFGRHLEVTETLVGVTKPLAYITADRSPALNAALGAVGYSGAPPRYVVVVPVKKSAQWWSLPPEARLKELEAHTAPTLASLATVKRKLYHSTGLDDADFITAFETADLLAFHELMRALASVKENTFHTRWGQPTVLGTLHPVEAVVRALSE